MITLENKNYEESFGTTAAASGQDPYLKSLVPKGALLTNYYGTGHVNLDNYISMISGQPSTVDTETDCFGIWSDIVDAGNDSAYPKILKPGTVTETGYNHYSLLKSLENIFGITEYLGYADTPNLTAFGSDIFNQ